MLERQYGYDESGKHSDDNSSADAMIELAVGYANDRLDECLEILTE